MSLFATSAAVAVDVLDAIFGDPGMFTAPSAAAVPIRIILSRQDPVVNLPGFEVGLRSPGVRGDVRQTDIPLRPVPGGTVTVGTVTYRINDVEEDEERTIWRLDLSV